MIDALITGRLIACERQGNALVGSIALADDKPVFFIARRSRVKAALQTLPVGIRMSIAGPLTTAVKQGSAGPYVRHEMLIEAVQAASQPKGLLARLFERQP